MMRLSVSVPFCVLCQCTRVIFATRLSASVTARTCPISDWEGLALAVRWGIVARYRGHEVCCIADSGDELSANGWRRVVLTRRRARARMRGQSAFFLSTTFEPTLAHSMNTRTGPKITSSTMPKAGSTFASVSSSGSCPS